MKEEILQLFSPEGGCVTGLWLGNPHPDTIKKYCAEFGFPDFETVRLHLGDHCRWLMGEEYAYSDERGWTLFEAFLQGRRRPLQEVSHLSEIERYPWPDPTKLDFTPLKQALQAKRDYVRFSGMWTPFFHLVADLFGMEQYFINMYTNPLLVEAVTEQVMHFYLEANERCFKECGAEIDVFFLGNDFGTQLDLLLSPSLLERFILPHLQKIVMLAKSYHLPVMLHSCGSIGKIIPRLLDIGIDALHPLQARAQGMDAETLAHRFKGKLTFVGGVDTQELLVHGTPREIRREVHRLRKTFGKRYIVSPSHEAILPNIPFANLEAMAQGTFDPL